MTATRTPTASTQPSAHVGAVVVNKNDGMVTASYALVPRPTASRGQVLVRPAYVGICGSDLEQLADHMPATFHIQYPHILGHEWAGVVVEVGPGVETFRVGDHLIGHGDLGGNRWFGVTHDGAMADLFAVDEKVCFLLPLEMDLATAAIIEPFVCVFAGLSKVGVVNASHRVHVHGLGAIGLCAVIQAVAARAQVVVFDPSRKRRELAIALGADAAVNPLDTDAAAHFAAAADVVIEASGAPAAQNAALESAATDARVLFMGVSAPRAVPARLGLIQERNLNLLSSTGAPGSVWGSAIRMVQRHGLDLKPLVSSTFSFADVTEALTRAADPGRETKVLLHPDPHPPKEPA